VNFEPSMIGLLNRRDYWHLLARPGSRDRRALTMYQEEISRINRALEERGRTRAELEKLLTP
jgi:hypothetical protein